MDGLVQWAVFLWSLFLIAFIGTGGYFMFRKFLQSMPKADGLSELDRRRMLIEQSLPLWTEDGKALLNELVTPVPKLFRDAAKEAIAAKIAELALNRGLSEIDTGTIIEGYIRATPRQDHRYLVRFLERKNIDVKPFSVLIDPHSRGRSMRQVKELEHHHRTTPNPTSKVK
ncbi:MAG: DUF2621 family protein [Hydrogenibacillus sp.]|nr:DUF2621 family protein [Hydrogenibacillus sp.]